MFNAYKVKYEIISEKDMKPFYRTYAFSASGKRQAMKIAIDILTDYIIDMKYYSGSIKQIKEDIEHQKQQ